MMTSLKYSQDTDSNAQMNCSRLNDTIFTKQLMKRLNKYNDDEQVTLQQSIPILYELNIFQQLTSIPDAKKRLTQQNKPNNRLQLQARFIYNLWKLIGNEFISMSYFKQIIGLFITLEISQLASKLQQIFENQNDLLIEILAIWEAMIENNDGGNASGFINNASLQNQQQQQYQQFRQSSVVTDEQQGEQQQQQQYDDDNEGNVNNYHYQRRHLKQRCNNNSSHYNNHNSNKSSHHIKNSTNVVNNNLRQQKQQQHVYQRQSYTNNHNNNNISNNNNINNKSTITTTQRQRFTSKSRRQNIQQVTDQIYINGLYQLPVMSVQKQKQLVNRLYVVNKNQRYQQLKKIQDQERMLKEMQQCTFRPNIEKNKKYKNNRIYGGTTIVRTMMGQQQRSTKTNITNINTNTTKKPSTSSSSRTIPGFEKAISRMKIGQQKTKQLKQKLQLRSSHTTTRQSKLLDHSKKQLIIQPPSFLTRQTNKKKQQQKKRVLFTIQFDIGRYKLTCKIHENEEAEQLARNIQSIYSLKQQSYQQIKSIIKQEIERYYEMNGDDGEGNQQYQQQYQQQNQEEHDEGEIN